jgi:2-oxoglutarate ferredoxin oxidoreductase subunit alpha
VTQSSVDIDSAVIRFAGDSGDGMQLTGNQFSDTAAALGNDLATLPDYPAEIRAPIGTVGGVSAYQVHFSAHDIRTPGDKLDVLVVMNAAALKKNLEDLKSGGYLFLDTSGFNKKNLKLSEYDSNPLEDGSLTDYRIISDDFTALTVNALTDMGLKSSQAKRCKNLFTLGMVFWLYGRDPQHTKDWLKKKFAKKPDVAQANCKAIEAGFNYANTIELFTESYNIRKADLPKGHYKKVS